MSKKDTLKDVDQEGQYIIPKNATPSEIIALALSLIEQRFQAHEVFNSPNESKSYATLQLGQHEQEVFACFFLDNRHRMIAFEKMFFGTIDGASVHPREVVKAALKHNAAALIFAHNHPSGVSEPSRADITLTRRLTDALSLVDIRVLDHLVVGAEDVTSLAERGLI